MIQRRRNDNTIEHINTYVPPVQMTPSSGTKVVGEVPAGVINGSNNQFTTAYNFVPNSVEVLVNGLNQKKTGFVTIGNNTVQLVISPLASDTLEINYTRL